jgi:hypothetical protein
MVAMITILEPDELVVQAEPMIASLLRFSQDGPVASILKSSLKGISEFCLSLW